jgi:hypothetical protein
MRRRPILNCSWLVVSLAAMALAGGRGFTTTSAAQAPVFSVPNSELAVSDSTFPWRDCGTFDVPLGSIRPSLGTVAYRMGRDGRADTATLRIVAAERISVAGYRSAVTRVLASCRMRVPRGLPREGVPVVQVIRFGGIGVMPHAARLTDSIPEGLPDDTVLLPTQGLPLAHEDPRLEEQATLLHPCLSTAGERPPTGPFASREEANRAFDQWAASMNGRVSFTVEIGMDGKPVSSTVQMIEAASPAATTSLVARLLRCRFAPARIGGRPIPAQARVNQGQQMERRAGP